MKIETKIALMPQEQAALEVLNETYTKCQRDNEIICTYCPFLRTFQGLDGLIMKYCVLRELKVVSNEL